MKSLISSGGIHVAPSRTLISDALRSLGCTRFNASTFGRYNSEFSAASIASFSFSLTFPDKYSSSDTNVGSFPGRSGRRKITPSSSFSISSARFPVKVHIYSISTRACSDSDRDKASLTISTLVTV